MSDDNKTTHTLNDLELALPKTATKVYKKRGRKGNQIAKCFKNIPTTPVDYEEYCESYNLKPTVVRQIKRHDSYKDDGKVFIRKGKDGKMKIWRDPNQKSTY